jgi:type I restriction-modification system DNA methylase subunit
VNKLIKTKHRVRDHGEVFTPDFIVENMLNLVKNETERIESRFLEPACGNGNFLSEVLKRKINIIEKKYKKSHHDFEKYMIIAV